MACPGRCQGFGSHVSRPWGFPSRKSGPAASAVPLCALRLGPTCSERRSRLVVGDAGVGRQARVHTPSATSQPRARSLYLCASASPPVAGDGSTLWRRGRLKVHVQSLAHWEWASPWLVRPALRTGVLGSAGSGREHSLTHPPSSSLPGRGSWDPGAGSRCPRPRPSPLGALLCCRKALHLDRSLERAASSACCRLTAAAGGVAPFKNKDSAERNSPRGQPPAFGQRGQGFGLTCRCLDAVTGKHSAFWSGEVPIQDEGRGPFRPPCQGVPVSCRWVARGCLSQGGDSLGSLFLVAGPEEG